MVGQAGVSAVGKVTNYKEVNQKTLEIFVLSNPKPKALSPKPKLEFTLPTSVMMKHGADLDR